MNGKCWTSAFFNLECPKHFFSTLKVILFQAPLTILQPTPFESRHAFCNHGSITTNYFTLSVYFQIRHDDIQFQIKGFLKDKKLQLQETFASSYLRRYSNFWAWALFNLRKEREVVYMHVNMSFSSNENTWHCVFSVNI